MARLCVRAAILAATVLSALQVVPAQAQATRTWVSGLGDDANPCSRTAPCKTFAGAISKTFINGEINCIDPGGFGAVTITKSITIDCLHVGGSILATFTSGIVVNIAASANDPLRIVRIRGLSINGTGASGSVGTRTGVDGIRVLQAASVFVEKTEIQDFALAGIRVGAAADVSLVLDDVMIRDCGGAGVRLETTAGMVRSTMNAVRVHACSAGIIAAGRASVDIGDSVLSLNATGVQTVGTANSITADSISVLQGTTGILASAGSVVRLSDSTVADNAVGLSPSGGSIISLQGNNLTGNGANGNFTSTTGKL